MTAAGLAVVNVDPAKIYGGAKDGNEAFTKDRPRLVNMIAYLERKAQEMKIARDEAKEEELRKRTGEGMLEDFLLTVTDKEACTFKPIKTGITDIDWALEGGFIRKTLVTLGAPPAMGKTCFAQWILENIATSGNDVLYLNLEMDRAQLIARSLSRIIWKNDKLDYSTLDILRGYEWKEDQREAITRAAEIYKKEIAPHFIYNPDGVDNTIDSILACMEEETGRIEAQGKQAPIICIDYLQLIDSGERDAVEGMKSIIFKLKDFAKRKNTIIFLIVANNRASNKAGTVEMESGRDTSAIEYSGDLMLGISYTAIEDRRTYTYTEEKNGKKKEITAEYDLDTIRRLKREAREAGREIPAVCNELSLKVLKNRFGEDERRANLIFDGKHNTFKMRDWTTCKEDLPFND
jgi:replicative DNA helicase